MIRKLLISTIIIASMHGSAIGQNTGTDQNSANELSSTKSTLISDLSSHSDNILTAIKEHRLNDAIVYAEEALAINTSLLGSNHIITISSLEILAKLYGAVGRLDDAIVLLLQLSDHNNAVFGPDHPKTLAVIRDLGGVYLKRGLPEEAEKMLKQALDGYKRILGPSHPDTLGALNGMALYLDYSGKHDEAAEIYIETLSVLEKSYGKNHEFTLSTVNNLGLSYSDMGLFGEAEPLLKRALAGRESTLGPKHRATLLSLDNLGTLYQKIGQPDRAEPFHLRSMEGYKSTLGDEHPDTLKSIGNLGFLYLSMDQFEKAEPLYRTAVNGFEVALGPEHPDTLSATSNLGMLELQRNRIDVAEPLLLHVLHSRRRVLGPDHRETLMSMNNLAGLRLGQQRYDDARQLFTLVLESLRRTSIDTDPFRVIASGNLSELYIDYLENNDIGIYYLKQSVNVLQAMRANMAELEDATQFAFLEDNRDTYEILQSALIFEGRFAEAGLVGRMLKEQEFYDFIRRRSADGEDPRQTTIAFTATETEWERQMDVWRERPNRLAQEYNVLLASYQSTDDWSDQDEARLQQSSLALDEANAAFHAQVASLTMQMTALASEQDGQMSREIAAMNTAAAEAYSSALDHDGPTTAMLQIIALEEATHLLFITKDALVHEEVAISRDELNKMIFAARATPGIGERVAADTADMPAINAQMGALYDRLIAPVKPHLDDAGIEVILIDAQGAVRYVPFAALHDGERYLGQDYLLALHNAAALTDYNRRTPQFSAASAFGVTQEHEGFTALPHVGAEIEALVPGEDGTGILQGSGFLDKTFTRTSLERNLGRGQVLHVATHYKMVPGDETDSRLLLGDGSFLTPAEILNSQAFKRLDQVDLVTLSACETGLTDQGIGAEVEGIGNIIQLKGANTVIATLWAVADDSTASFMTYFYTGLVTDDLTKAGALQAAQKQMIESADHSAPYYWAPYIIMGNWR